MSNIESNTDEGEGTKQNDCERVRSLQLLDILYLQTTIPTITYQSSPLVKFSIKKVSKNEQVLTVGRYKIFFRKENILCKNSEFTNILIQEILHRYRFGHRSDNLFFKREFFDFRWFIFVLWTTWMLGQPPLAVLPPGKISYTCRIAPHIIINYRCARTGGGLTAQCHCVPLAWRSLGHYSALKQLVTCTVRLTTTSLHSVATRIRRTLIITMHLWDKQSKNLVMII